MVDRLICGLDEAGRGPLAGPLLAAAVVFPVDFDFAKAVPDLPLRDSKKLSRIARERLLSSIQALAVVYKIEKIDVKDINSKGIGWANRTIFERLIMAIDADEYIVDGNLKLNIPMPKKNRVRSMVRADDSIQAVQAAAILAKIHRDWIMETLHRSHPVYGWDHNMGYGTRAHIEALRIYGPCSLHRRKFVHTALHHTIPLPLDTEAKNSE